MADQKACTLCGAEGHFASQCSWNAAIVQCDDGVHAINLCEGLSHYGWVMRKHPDGGYFSVRKATSSELGQAKLRATFDLHYQALLSATSPALEQEKQKPIAWAVFDGAWINDHTADPNRAEQWAEEGKQVVALYAAPVDQVGQVPEGCAIVPLEPTPKMIDATWNHPIDRNGGIESQNARNARIYKAMVAATPAQGV